MKTNIFICMTPFQVFSSTAIAMQVGGVSDIVITNAFRGAAGLSAKLEESGLFRRIFRIDESKVWKLNEKSYLKKELSVVRLYANLKKTAEKLFPDVASYTDVFVLGRKSVVGKIVYNYAAQYNKDAHIHFYDEGTAVYSNYGLDITRSDWLCTRLFIGAKAANFQYNLYLYSPECYRFLNPDRKTEIVRILLPEKTRETLASVFSENIAIPEDMEAIVFDVIYDRVFDENGKAAYRELITYISEKLNCRVKAHPREPQPYFSRIALESSLPFEMLWLNAAVKDKILIAPFSTALFTPRLIFNEEPPVIFLYKMIEGINSAEAGSFDRLMQWIVKSYSKKENIFIPENYEELDHAISCLKQR